MYREEKQREFEMQITLDSTTVIKNGNKNEISMYKLSNNENILLSSRELISNDFEKNYSFSRLSDFRNKTKYSQILDIGTVEAILRHYLEIIYKCNVKVKRAIAYYKEVYTEKIIVAQDIGINHDVLDVAFKINIFLDNNGRIENDTFYDGSSESREILLGREDEISRFVNEFIRITSYPLLASNINNKGILLLDQQLTGIFIHEVVGHLAEADSAYSFNEIERGTQLCHKNINIEDVQNKNARGYQMFDDEGTLCTNQVIISKGKIVGRMNTCITAAYFQELPKGNARSISVLHRPICRMRHTKLQKGKIEVNDILKSESNLIYLIGTKGGTTGFDFSITAKYGLIINKGIIIGRIMSPTLIGNVFKALAGITDICNDYKVTNFYNGCGKNEQYPLPVSFSAPSISIREGLIFG